MSLQCGEPSAYKAMLKSSLINIHRVLILDCEFGLVNKLQAADNFCCDELKALYQWRYTSQSSLYYSGWTYKTWSIHFCTSLLSSDLIMLGFEQPASMQAMYCFTKIFVWYFRAQQCGDFAWSSVTKKLPLFTVQDWNITRIRISAVHAMLCGRARQKCCDLASIIWRVWSWDQVWSLTDPDVPRSSAPTPDINS